MPFQLSNEPELESQKENPISYLEDRTRRLLAIFLFLCAFVYLHLTLFATLRVPFDLSYGDNGLGFTEAQRILKGQVIYRDFFDILLPGVPYLDALLLKLFGARAWLPNACLVSLGIGFLWASFVISRRLLPGLSALLPGFLFLVFAFHKYLDPTHHLYSNLLITAAIAVIAARRSPARLAGAGALCGLAAIFSQAHGVFAALALAVFVWWDAIADRKEKRDILRAEGCYLAPFFVILGACILYFAAEAGIGRFINLTIIFPCKFWNATYDPNSFSDYALAVVAQEFFYHPYHIPRPLIVGLLIPAVYILAIISYRRRDSRASNGQWRQIMLLCAVGLSLFASIVNSADIARMSSIAMPAFIIAVWLIQRRKWTRGAIALAWMAVAIVMLRDIWFVRARAPVYVDTPAGRIALNPIAGNSRAYYQWLASNTHPGDYVFDATGHPGLYFLFGLRNPTGLWWLTSCNFTRPEQVPGVLQGLKQHQVPLILWSAGVDLKCGPNTDHIQPIREYLHRCYRQIGTFRDSFDSTASVWRRQS